MVTATSFKLRFPEFDTIDDSRIELFLSDAELSVNRVSWGPKGDLAVQYLAAHMLSLSPSTQSLNLPGGGGRPVSSETVGPLSRTYAIPAASSNGGSLDSYFIQTSYGQEYLRLRKSIYSAPFVV